MCRSLDYVFWATLPRSTKPGGVGAVPRSAGGAGHGSCALLQDASKMHDPLHVLWEKRVSRTPFLVGRAVGPLVWPWRRTDVVAWCRQSAQILSTAVLRSSRTCYDLRFEAGCLIFVDHFTRSPDPRRLAATAISGTADAGIAPGRGKVALVVAELGDTWQ